MANEFISNEQTEIIQKLIREIVNDPTTYKGSAYLPSVTQASRKIRTEVIEASGGLTNQHLIGADVKYIQSSGSRVEEFIAPQYKEAIHYDENEILFLRELGQNDKSKRGIKQKIDIDSDRLNRRLEARIEYERWNSIFTGGFTWMGSTFSYGIPSGNQTVPVGAKWSLDAGVTANAAANPLKDIRYWTQGGLARFRKYKITKLIMNGNTSRLILDNANTTSFISSLGANSAFANGFDINAVVKYAIPGSPAVEIYNGWYQAETIDSNGKITVGDALYFIPDGYIFFECALPGGDAIGEFVQGIHLATGSVEEPGVGKFFVVDDNLAPGTQGGPKNPFMDLVAGVYGGVNLQRAFDVLTAYVL
jgi:hypothetical protein